jgi:hypothetical protein
MSAVRRENAVAPTIVGRDLHCFEAFRRIFVGIDRPDCAPTTPLLEQERDAGGGALVAQRSRPVGVHRPRAVLAAGDDPVDASVWIAVAVEHVLFPIRADHQADSVSTGEIDRPEQRLAR